MNNMKKFKATFIKIPTIINSKDRFVQLAEQTIITDKENLEIKIPKGYALVNYIEFLPDIIDITVKDEKLKN
jgi:hypothetical protein